MGPEPQRVTFFGATDRGLIRSVNQDAFLIVDLADCPAWPVLGVGSSDAVEMQANVYAIVRRPGMVMLVADGMGSGAGGIASHLTTRAIRESLTDETAVADESWDRRIMRAVLHANDRVRNLVDVQPELEGIGTTLTLVVIAERTLHVAQVGDSRAYLIRDGVLDQLTRDQSVVQAMVDDGSLTEEEAAASQLRNLVLQAVGIESSLAVAVSEHSLLPGDAVMLCSDGLSGQVQRDQILDALANGVAPDVVCRRLIDLANEQGGPDNITAVVARFD